MGQAYIWHTQWKNRDHAWYSECYFGTEKKAQDHYEENSDFVEPPTKIRFIKFTILNLLNNYHLE